MDGNVDWLVSSPLSFPLSHVTLCSMAASPVCAVAGTAADVSARATATARIRATCLTETSFVAGYPVLEMVGFEA